MRDFDSSRKRALLLGVGLTAILIFLWALGDTGNKSVRLATHRWPWFLKVVVTVPGLLAIFYGLWPNSKVGHYGKKVTEVLYWVFQKMK